MSSKRYAPLAIWKSRRLFAVMCLAALLACGHLRAAPTQSPLHKHQATPGYGDRVDPWGGLRPWPLIRRTLEALRAKYPGMARLEKLGQSAEGRDLLALHVSRDPTDLSRPTIMLTAAHHANEASTPEHALDAAKWLLEHADEQPAKTWLEHMALVVVPMVNPDGSHAFWYVNPQLGRKSRRAVTPVQQNLGVDLNRNYPQFWDGPEYRYSSNNPESNFYRGPKAASEPEVRALIALAERIRPVALISYHAAAARLVMPYSTPGVEAPDPSIVQAVAQSMLARLTHGFGRKADRFFAVTEQLYPVTGAEKDWYHHRFGTAAYALELPYRRARKERLLESITHTRGAWKALFDRWLAGPSLSVQSVDESSEPVVARVSIDEVRMRAGEHWQTDRDNGWFHIYLPAAGTYTVRLQAGGVEVSERVVAGRGYTRIAVVVPTAWDGVSSIYLIDESASSQGARERAASNQTHSRPVGSNDITSGE